MPVMPYLYNLFKSIWSTVSKAFLRTRKVPTTISPLSIADTILSINVIRAILGYIHYEIQTDIYTVNCAFE